MTADEVGLLTREGIGEEKIQGRREWQILSDWNRIILTLGKPKRTRKVGRHRGVLLRRKEEEDCYRENESSSKANGQKLGVKACKGENGSLTCITMKIAKDNTLRFGRSKCK